MSNKSGTAIFLEPLKMVFQNRLSFSTISAQSSYTGMALRERELKCAQESRSYLPGSTTETLPLNQGVVMTEAKQLSLASDKRHRQQGRKRERK